MACCDFSGQCQSNQIQTFTHYHIPIGRRKRSLSTKFRFGFIFPRAVVASRCSNSPGPLSCGPPGGHMTLKTRNAIVTGSTSGIGLAIARALAKEGANVMINGMGDAAAIEAERAGMAKEFGVTAIYSDADMTKPDEIHAMVKEAQAKLGSVDILVNNAGVQHVAPIEEFPRENWDMIIAINLSAAFHAMAAAIPGMKARKWGRIHAVRRSTGTERRIIKALGFQS